MTYFLDFDRTIFDTDGFIAHLAKRSDTSAISYESEEELAAKLEEMSRGMRLAFEPEELELFVYDDAREFLKTKAGDAIVLTYGNPTLQKLKVENALAGLPGLSALYTANVRKGAYMKERMASYEPAALIDDRPVELEVMAAECPGVRLFEMRRDGGAGDGRWPVIRTLAEIA